MKTGQSEKQTSQKEEARDAQTTQKSSYIKEQADYWKAFVHDLFVGTLKRMLVSPVAFGLAFFAIAYLISRLSIRPQNVFGLLKFFEALILYILYLLIGIFSGLAYGVNSTLLKKTEELEKGIHLIINPLMAGIIEKMPGGQKTMSVEEFNQLLDEQIRRFKRKSPFRFRFLSLAGMFSLFFVRMTLRILRYILLHDFVANLEENGETQVSAKTVEAYYRDKVVSNIAGVFIGKLELVQKGVYGMLIIFLVIPIGLIIIF